MALMETKAVSSDNCINYPKQKQLGCTKSVRPIRNIMACVRCQEVTILQILLLE